MKYYLIAVLSIFLSSAKAQKYYSFSQLDSLQKIEKKNVVVFVSTNWCNYCKIMEQKVFKKPKIAQQLSNSYHLIKLDAEDKNAIFYRGQNFKYNASLGYHEIALSLFANQKLIFPSLCILNSENQMLYQHQGFTNEASLSQILQYFVN
jgi:thioredoxin-related protein